MNYMNYHNTGMTYHQYGVPMPKPLCGCFTIVKSVRKYLPQVRVHAHTTILASTSRTTLTQTFQNSNPDKAIDELRYVFPLYDGVSVVAFTCTVGERVIKGVVKEREKAKQVYKEAKERGETAGLLEQSFEAADVFTTTIGNVPAGEKVKVEITYLGELKHDAEVDGVRFTIPTNIVPRYGNADSLNAGKTPIKDGGFTVTVDAEMPHGSAIKSIQSPSHPISVNIGTTSTAADADPSLQKASATLSLASAELDKDFVLLVVATNLGNPTAVLETHATIPNQRALMTTLVPKFNLPAEKPEIVFVCDRSGSMSGQIPDLQNALQIFLKSLPVGVKFNICSFGTRHYFLWDKSQSYNQESLDKAVKHVKKFTANYGGTEMYRPVAETIKRRYKDMNLEIFLLTDGEIWDQEKLFTLINENVEESKGAIRVFTLGVGSGASTSLIEGAARAGRGFAQSVNDNEKMDKKVVRMLKGSLFPHITDYSLEIKYEKETEAETDADDDFEVIEKVLDGLTIETTGEDQPIPEAPKKPISLFNPDHKDDDTEMTDAPVGIDNKFDHLPTVSVPRYLQTPSEIPPLFPFNRTTAYVLLSDETPNQKPKSVLLKGTSSHGPLELEIPITVLTDKGTTIHQLAARKEVKELEEGRGWLAHAKDGSGALLKTKFEGRYQDLVEREAVRLGVEYQVGGKWCSFVAVQANAGEEEKEVEGFEVVEQESAPAQPVGFGGPQQVLMRSRAAPGGGGPPMRSAVAAASFGAPPGGALQSFGAPCPPPAPAPSVRSRGGTSLFGAVIQQEQQQQQQQQGLSRPRKMLHSKAARRSVPSSSAAAAPQAQEVDEGLLESYKTQMMESAAMPLPDEDSDDDMGFALMDDAAPAPKAEVGKAKSKKKSLFSVSSPFSRRKSSASASSSASSSSGVDTTNALQALIALQTFVGSWTWSGDLEKVLGVTAKKAERVTEVRGDVLATVCAVVFLRKKLGGERDAWEMVVEKAVEWLEGEVEDLEGVEKSVESLF